MENPGQVSVQIQELLDLYGLDVLAALVTLFFGRIVANWGRRLVEPVMEKGPMEKIVIGYVSCIVSITAMAFVVLAAIGQLGIQTTGFIAILGAAGLAIGLARQGLLANIASGSMPVVFRSFKVGNFVRAGTGTPYPQRDVHVYEHKAA